MTLNDYLERTKETDAAFGASVGLSQSYVNRLKRGHCSPSLQTIKTISERTGGAVTADDFISGAVAAAPLPFGRKHEPKRKSKSWEKRPNLRSAKCHE